MAITASAPGRFSTTTGWPHCFDSRSASIRPVRSAPAPGPSGTMNLTGRFGHACANAALDSRTSASARIFFITPPRCLFIVDGDLDQVQVRIPDVHRADRPVGAGLGDRALDDLHVVLLQALDDVL